MKRICWLLLVSSSLFARPADLVSFAGGVFDLLHERHRTAEFSAEYKFGVSGPTTPFYFLEFRPLLGIMATIKGSTYLYGGINFDLLVCDQFVIAPGFAAGWYRAGQGKNLGYPLEFRSGVEAAWIFSDGRRLGAHFYHLSNASLGHRNPGEESLVLFFDIPVRKGFPFK